MVDEEELRQLCARLNDEELRRRARGDLVPAARAVFEAELLARGLPVEQPSLEEALLSFDAEPSGSRLRRFYRPPAAAVADIADTAVVITAPGLVRLFQGMVITSTVLGLLVSFWPLVPLPIGHDTGLVRQQAGVGALSLPASQLIFMALQPAFVLAAVGLCFFRRWGRHLFVAATVSGYVGTLAGGMVVLFPLEHLALGLTGLLDGATLALAFLPPLSRYFARAG